jgi:hypothetical protein
MEAAKREQSALPKPLPAQVDKVAAQDSLLIEMSIFDRARVRSGCFRNASGVPCR